MKLSALNAALEDPKKIPQLKIAILKEAKIYATPVERGKSISVYCEEDCAVTITKEKVLQLMYAGLKQQLTFLEVAYILDALALGFSTKLSSESLHDLVCEIAALEPIDNEVIEYAIEKLERLDERVV